MRPFGTSVRLATSMASRSAVNAYFDSQAGYWRRIYESKGVYETIHQQRRTRVLGLIDRLFLPSGARILEVGCGAGSVATALAGRGYVVYATDLVPAMLSLTRRLAVDSGVEERVRTSLADVRALAFPSGSFDVVIAMGVLPWVPPPLERPLAEVARVLRCGGYLVTNTDNCWRLNHVLDPWLGIRPLLGSTARRLGLQRERPSAHAYTCSNWHFDELLHRAGFVKLHGHTLGFGPFSLFTHRVVPEPVGMKLHCKLQRLADRGFPVVRACGSQYIVMAKREG
jgi:ubiquinone/menaquinone biosynthesis C-methylase UbiE